MKPPFLIGTSLLEIPLEIIQKADLSDKECERGFVTPEVAEKLSKVCEPKRRGPNLSTGRYKTRAELEDAVLAFTDEGMSFDRVGRICRVSHTTVRRIYTQSALAGQPGTV